MATEPLPRTDAPLARRSRSTTSRSSVPEGVDASCAPPSWPASRSRRCARTRSSRPSAAAGCARSRSTGMRGYPLACSTSAQAGMEVTTDTVALREMREEILQLILSRASRRAACSATRRTECRAQPDDDPQGRRLDRVPQLPQRRRTASCRRSSSRSASTELELPGLLPRARAGARRPLLRPRLQPLHPLRTLRAHVPRGARRVGALVQVPRPADPDRPGVRRLARRGRLRVLRRLRVGVPDRRARRQGVEVGRRAGRRRDVDLPVLRPRLPARDRPHGRAPVVGAGAHDDARSTTGSSACAAASACPRRPITTTGPRKPMLRARHVLPRGRTGTRRSTRSPAELAGVAPRRRPHARSPPTSRTRACTPRSASCAPAWGRRRHRLDRAAPACPAARRCGPASSRCPISMHELGARPTRSSWPASTRASPSRSPACRCGARVRRGRDARRRRRARVEPRARTPTAGCAAPPGEEARVLAACCGRCVEAGGAAGADAAGERRSALADAARAPRRRRRTLAVVVGPRVLRRAIGGRGSSSPELEALAATRRRDRGAALRRRQRARRPRAGRLRRGAPGPRRGRGDAG